MIDPGEARSRTLQGARRRFHDARGRGGRIPRTRRAAAPR